MSTQAPANGRPTTASFLRRVRIRDFKSIAHCDVELGPLTVLVGKNGSGKSNFVDALRFVSDELWMSAGAVIEDRRNVDMVRKGKGSPSGFELELDVDVGDGRRAVYGFKYASRGDHWPERVSEHLSISGANGEVGAFYVVKNGQVQEFSEFERPPVPDDRLYLANASGFPVFREVYDALLGMQFYDLNPEAMSKLWNPSAVKFFVNDGRNIASVIGRLGSEQPELKKRILEYLALIVPDITDVNRAAFGPRETIEFTQEVPSSNTPRKFFAESMSDGTLRVLGTLVAATQLAEGTGKVRLVGIEEPETALHPAASAALMSALQEAAVDGQVIVTTHSPDLIDQLELDADRLLVVEMRDGETVIGPIDRASQETIKEQWYTPGQLLSMDQLVLDRIPFEPQRKVRLAESAEPTE